MKVDEGVTLARLAKFKSVIDRSIVKGVYKGVRLAGGDVSESEIHRNTRIAHPRATIPDRV